MPIPNVWTQCKLTIENLLTDTPIETSARRLWWELRALSHNKYKVRRQSRRDMLKFISMVVRYDFNTVDIGANRGNILRHLITAAPHGHHIAVEPIEYLANDLRQKFSHRNVTVVQTALSDRVGTSPFYALPEKPGRSSLRRQDHKLFDNVAPIIVDVNTLDTILPDNFHVNLIKIDVEGAELLVMKGAKETIKRYKPYIIFECSKQLSESFNVNPEMIYSFLTAECGMCISTLSRYIKDKTPLTQEDFIDTLKERHSDLVAYNLEH